VKPMSAHRKAAGEFLSPPAALSPTKEFRTITDGFGGDYNVAAPGTAEKSRFDFGRHRWLGLAVRDSRLPGAAHRVAVVLWEKQNAARGYAWPSLVYLATELDMHKSTVIRSLRSLQERGWITRKRRGGRHRSNEYRIAFGNVSDDGAE